MNSHTKLYELYVVNDVPVQLADRKQVCNDLGLCFHNIDQAELDDW